MREVTNLIVNEWKILDLGYDFAGFSIQKKNLSYHHMIIPKRLGGPETVKNGCVLNSKSSHPYIHTIEEFDEDMFYAITSELIDENIRGKLDMSNILRIYDIMDCFEREYNNKRRRSGKEIIKPEFRERLLKR